MKYSCQDCKYYSNSKRNYERHIESNKHKKTTDTPDKSFKCPYCENSYYQASGLSRHKQVCSVLEKQRHQREIEKIHNNYILQLKDKENEIAILSLKNENLITLLESKDEMASVKDTCNNKTMTILENENKFHKKLVEGSSKIVNSISAIAYAKKHYPDAKALVEYTDMEALKTEKGYGIAEAMIFYNENNRIAEVIGKIILNKYKEDRPELQSLWNTDFSRLAYIVVEGKGCNKRWIVDKGGVKVKQMIIEPILKHIREKLFEYCGENAKLMGINNNKKFDYDTYEKYCENISNSNALIKKIDNGITSNKIIQYLSQYLHINEVKKIEV